VIDTEFVLVKKLRTYLSNEYSYEYLLSWLKFNIYSWQNVVINYLSWILFFNWMNIFLAQQIKHEWIWHVPLYCLSFFHNLLIFLLLIDLTVCNFSSNQRKLMLFVLSWIFSRHIKCVNFDIRIKSRKIFSINSFKLLIQLKFFFLLYNIFKKSKFSVTSIIQTRLFINQVNIFQLKVIRKLWFILFSQIWH